jgi:putative acetyltransferase
LLDFIAELSLAASKEGRVVGRILFSRIIITIMQAENGTLPSLTMEQSMALHPEFQHRGTGSLIIRQGMKHCRKLEPEIIDGHPGYYRRFGFLSARAKGFEAPIPVPNAAFMVTEVVSDAFHGVSGMVVCPVLFEGVWTGAR